MCLVNIGDAKGKIPKAEKKTENATIKELVKTKCTKYKNLAVYQNSSLTHKKDLPVPHTKNYNQNK
jgi:hypothetical protein